MNVLRNRNSLILLLLFIFSSTAKAEPRIMALGDSITKGAQSYPFEVEYFSASAYRLHDDQIPNDLRSYREHLHDWLTQTSCKANVSWVGSEELTGRTPSNHEGHGGWNSALILNEIPTWLTEYTPDILILNIGTNDLIQGQTVAKTTENIEGILGEIDEYELANNTEVSVYIGNMAPIVGWYANHDRRGNISDTEIRRAELSESIQNLSYYRSSMGDKVNLVDINSDFFIDEGDTRNCLTQQPGNPKNMMMTRCQAHLPQNSPDGIHPNLLGDEFIAQTIYAELNRHANLCKSDSDTLPELTTTISNPIRHDTILNENTTFSGSVLNTGSSRIEDIRIHIRDRDEMQWATVGASANFIETDDKELEWFYDAALASGNYTLFVKAINAEGKTSARFGKRFSVQSDNTVPVVDFNHPETNSININDSLILSGTASVPVGSELKKVLLYIRNRDNKSWEFIALEAHLSPTSNASADWSYSADLAPGNYTAFVKAIDTENNESSNTTRKFQIQ